MNNLLKVNVCEVVDAGHTPTIATSIILTRSHSSEGQVTRHTAGQCCLMVKDTDSSMKLPRSFVLGAGGRQSPLEVESTWPETYPSFTYWKPRGCLYTGCSLGSTMKRAISTPPSL